MTTNVTMEKGNRLVTVKVSSRFKMYGFDFIVHKSLETGCENLWNVSELTSGAAALYNQRTKKIAVAEAIKRLKKIGKKEVMIAVEYANQLKKEGKNHD